MAVGRGGAAVSAQGWAVLMAARRRLFRFIYYALLSALLVIGLAAVVSFPKKQAARVIDVAGGYVPPSPYCIYHPPRVCVAVTVNKRGFFNHG